MDACCVEGCESTLTDDPTNVNNNNPHQAPSISFYRFPKKKALRDRWLKAIGLPDWDVPSTAHVCSKHFSSQQFNHLDNTIKDNGYPDSALPILSCIGVEATRLQVCRFCLATNIKMLSLKSGVLKTCLETMVGLHENHDVEGLPQYLCYICAAYLIKMYNIIEKSMIAQATLLEIYAENLKVTKTLIYEQNRQKLNLLHSLQSHNETPCTVYEYVYNEKLQTSVLVADKREGNRSAKESSSGDMTDSESDLKAERLNKLCRKLKQDIDESEGLLPEIYDDPFSIDDDNSETDDISDKSKSDKKIRKLKGKYHKDMRNKNKDSNESYIDVDSSDSDDCEEHGADERSTMYTKDHNYSRVLADNKKLSVTTDNIENDGDRARQDNNNKVVVKFVTQSDDIQITEVKSLIHADKRMESRNSRSEIKARDKKGSSVGELSLDHCYAIFDLNLKEQKEEWMRSKKEPVNLQDSVRCGVCSTWHRRGQTYQDHVARHNPKYGDYQCQVCKVRFVKEVFLKRHVNMTHSKKYVCNKCPITLFSLSAANYHRLKHDKSRKQCTLCARLFMSKVGLRVHMAAMHPTAPCWRPQNEYVCKLCNVSFESQAAHREHYLKCQNKEPPSLLQRLLEGDDATRTCNECGQRYTSRERLLTHRRDVHGRGLGRRWEEYPAKFDRNPLRSVKFAGTVQATTSSGDNSHTSKKLPSVEQTYECPICDNVFKATSTLNQHILDVHQPIQFKKATDSTKKSDNHWNNKSVEDDSNVDIDQKWTENIKNSDVTVIEDSETEYSSDEAALGDGDQEMADVEEDRHGDYGSDTIQEDYVELEVLNMEVFEEDI